MASEFERNLPDRFLIKTLEPTIPLIQSDILYILSQIDITKIRLIVVHKKDNNQTAYLIRHYNPEKWSFFSIGKMGVGESINTHLDEIQQYYGSELINLMISPLLEMKQYA